VVVVMLSAQGLSFGYGPDRPPIFTDLSFDLPEGRIMCVLGPNGAGKSTLIKCLAGLMTPSAGRIFIGDRDIRDLGRRRTAQLLAYVPQTHQPVFAFSVFDFVLMGRSPHIGPFSSPAKRDREKAEGAIESLGLTHLADRPYTEISGGERQLAMFARVVAQDPKLLLLDEPTSHLDFGNQVLVLALIQGLARQGLTIIMTSHFPDHAFLTSDLAAVMSGGGFARLGRPDEVVTEDALSRVYGIEVRIMDLDDGRVCVPVMPQSFDQALAAIAGRKAAGS
jgi:iron complex transport system ATP-binding protein